MAPLMDMAVARGRVAPGACPPRNLYSMTINAKTGAQEMKTATKVMRRDFVLPKSRVEGMVKDSDGELVRLCPECGLPVGDFGYASRGTFMHGECKAQLMLREAKEDEAARLRSDANLKRKERNKYNIGWKKEMIPRNVDLSSKLHGHHIPEGMVSLMLTNGKLVVLPTVDPAASINLEYLSLALRVRVQEGREPLFSLDLKGSPTSQSHEVEDLWQVKRFEPQWLAGTSVGEVMFQADYHLKELSMGEHEQPVVGMQSALDLATNGWHENDWRAREWFVVNHAEVRTTEGNTLIPHVQMGVEAREQINGPDGIEDAKITRADHPLVKYAEAFTHYFDVIAERRSSIYHLRELAKASVLSKFLLDTQVDLEDCWFDLINDVKQLYKMEIPQLWNQQNFSQVSVENGKIVGAEKGMDMGTRGIYGGVQFGLDKFDLGATTMQPGAGEAPYSLLFSAADRGAVMARGVVTPPSLMEPRGVDLNLNKFDLTQTAAAAETGSGAVGTAFWSNLECKEGSVFKDADKTLLRDLFNPFLSDRRQDADHFSPPEMRAAHLDALRSLIEEETENKEARRKHFVSKEFEVGMAGPLFPSSWNSSFGIAGAAPQSLREEEADRSMVDLAEKTAPVFDKTAEDGTRFRVYRLEDLEVRTVHDLDGLEVACAMFKEQEEELCSTSVLEDESVVKVVEYVEQAREGINYYIVMETARGQKIVTESLSEKIAWRENPKGLKARNNKAKVVNLVENVCVTVGVLKALALASTPCKSTSERKHFARSIFQKAQA